LELVGVGYQFDITTNYQFGGSDFEGNGGGPDTGFLTIANNGLSTFTGTLRLFGDSGTGIFGHILWDHSFTGSLAPSESKVFAGTTEGSNYGGFNPTTVPEPSSIMLFGSSLMLVAGFLRKRSLRRS